MFTVCLLWQGILNISLYQNNQFPQQGNEEGDIFFCHTFIDNETERHRAKKVAPCYTAANGGARPQGWAVPL